MHQPQSSDDLCEFARYPAHAGSKSEYLKRIADASIASHTPINAFLDMPILLFYDCVAAIHEVFEARKKK